MPFSFRRLSKAGWLSLGVLVVLGLTVWALNSGWKRPTTSLAAAQATPTPPPIKVVSFTLTSAGFSPAEITIPEGLYLLDINNRSGRTNLNLQFGDLNARKLKETKPVKDKDGRLIPLQDFRGLFDLRNGRYTITEANNPKWIADIKVTQKEK
jgi:hypothetical protein